MRTSWDYVVVGSGLAGLTFALKAADHGDVCVLTKAEVSDTNTSFAQGGIAAAVGESDSWELHEKDTLIAGAGLCLPDAVRQLVQGAPAAINWLQSVGAVFNVDPSQVLTLGREGGHSRSRIVHHADKTGWEIERAVTAAVRKHPRITVIENSYVTQILKLDDRCVGVEVQVPDIGQKQMLGRATLVATGGCGMVYQRTTNPRVATGDGIGLAKRAGVEISMMEFMQFHPTVLVHKQLPGFLITEACRGEGGTLRNHEGSRFMYDYDKRMELAPRDIVARAIEREIERLDTWCVYLDLTHLSPSILKEEFPTIWERLRTVGIKIEQDWIPVAPAQHYACGGITTDLQGRTSLPGLYASGEAACTGVHGANRLASNSLLEAIVFSVEAANAVQHEPETGDPAQAEPRGSIRESDAIHYKKLLQAAMTHHAGVFRTDEGLAEAAGVIRSISDEVQRLPRVEFSAYAEEVLNLIDVADSVVSGAQSRKENVGLHYNEDQANSELPSNRSSE